MPGRYFPIITTGNSRPTLDVWRDHFTLFQHHTMISDLWTDQHNVRLYTVKQNVENGWRYDILISVYSNKISPTMILMIVNVIWPTRMYCELVYTSLTIIFFYNIKMICTIITLYIGLCIKTLLYTTFNQIKNYFEYLLWGNAILFVTKFFNSVETIRNENYLLCSPYNFEPESMEKLVCANYKNIYSKNYFICRCQSLTSFGLLKHHNYTMVEWKEKSQEMHVL